MAKTQYKKCQGETEVERYAGLLSRRTLNMEVRACP